MWGESIFFVKFKISLEIHVQYIHTLLTCLSSCCVFTLCQSHNFSKLNNGWVVRVSESTPTAQQDFRRVFTANKTLKGGLFFFVVDWVSQIIFISEVTTFFYKKALLRGRFTVCHSSDEKSRGNHAAANLQNIFTHHHSAMTGWLSDCSRHQYTCREGWSDLDAHIYVNENYTLQT